MRIERIPYNCGVCNYKTELSWKGDDLFTSEGKKINFRRACPNCGYLPRLTEEEINSILKEKVKSG
jgi:hypothetical protein